ncbi:hypothetical protein ONZ45_g6279 [Pleurotus djamor]|nr:hypothetical protein ONZ45_g6279 [Pleurotus djamor]
MPARTFEETGDDSMKQLLDSIHRIFNEAQDSVTNHQKNCTHLYKIHAEAATFVETVKRKGRDSFKNVGETAFSNTFLSMMLRCLESLEERQQTKDDTETRAFRFTTKLLRKLLEGFEAKDKNVRYRVLQFVTEMVAHLGELEYVVVFNARVKFSYGKYFSADDYTALHQALRARVYDKETPVRVQAVIALSRLVESEDPEEVPTDELSGLEMIVQALSEDPAPEVRRAALLNLLVDRETLPYILDRMRDTDLTMRKMVFSNVLASNINARNEKGDVVMGPTHPRTMTIKQREQIVNEGLGDRDTHVQDAASMLMCRWLESVPCVVVKPDEATPADPLKKEENEGSVDPAALTLRGSLLNFLGLFDLGEGTVADKAVMSIFKTRPEILRSLDFSGDDYWEKPSSETVSLVRIFVDYCKNDKLHARLENTLPVIDTLVRRLQRAYNSLEPEDPNAAVVIDLTDDVKDGDEDERTEKELIIVEMLRLATQLDYADEIGRRRMFSLVRQMMAQRALPSCLLAPCLDLLRELSNSESDLIRLVTETINDLRIAPDVEETEAPAPPSSDDLQATPVATKPPRVTLNGRDDLEKDDIDTRCLLLCIGMLERVNGTLENNSTLDGVLHDLIVPSVLREHVDFREKGLAALGLCSLISPKLAKDTFELFVKQFKSKNPTALKIRLKSLIFDIVMTYESQFLNDKKREETQAALLYGLQETGFSEASSKEEDTLQALICMGLAKLILAGMITDLTVLGQLAHCYFSSDTSDNQELKQCLAYFFSAYSSVSSENQDNLRQIFMSTIKKFSALRQEIDDPDDLVPVMTIALMMLEWMNPNRLNSDSNQTIDEEIHLKLAKNILHDLADSKSELTKEDIKALTQCFLKLYLPDEADLLTLRTIRVFLNALTTRRPFKEAAIKNAILKFENIFCAKYADLVDGFTEAEYRKLVELEDLFEYLDDVIPLDEGGSDLDVKPYIGKKRRSTSIISTTTDRGDATSVATSRSTRSRTGAKKPRISHTDSDSDDEIQEIPPPPMRSTRPQRAAASQPKEVIEISSDDDEPPTPVPRRQRRSPSIQVKAESGDPNSFVRRAFGSTATGNDSLMDDDSEEEDEVSGILGGHSDD